MSYTKPTPLVGGQIRRSIQAQWRPGHIIERVTTAQNTPFAQLSQQLPSGARITWATIKTATAVPFYLGSTAAATNGQAAAALVWTAPSSLATGATTANLLLSVAQTAFGAAVPINSESRGYAASAATAGGILQSAANWNMNTSTSALTFYVIPYASSTGATDATQRFLVNTTTPTNGYSFGSTTATTATVSFDVQIFFEEFVGTADS